MPDVINTAIIGFGLSGKVFHAPFIHTHPGFHLSVVVERHNQLSKALYPYVDVLKNYKFLLEDHTIDLVVVATPNAYHYPMVKDLLEAGKHVIVEKPFVPSSAEADDLIALASQEEKNIFVYQNRRWDGDFMTIAGLISDGALGNIKYYEEHFDRYSPELKAGAWRDEDIPGGGILYDLGSHLIDHCLYLFGMPQSIKADIKAQRKGSPVDDFFSLELHYDHLTAVLTAGMMVKEKGPRFIVDGTKGSFLKWGIDPQEASLKAGEMPVGEGWGKDNPKLYGTLARGMAVPQEITQQPTLQGNYMAFYDNVYNTLRKDSEPAVLPEQARDVIFIIEKAIESSRAGRTIKTQKKNQ